MNYAAPPIFSGSLSQCTPAAINYLQWSLSRFPQAALIGQQLFALNILLERLRVEPEDHWLLEYLFLSSLHLVLHTQSIPQSIAVPPSYFPANQG